jgi:hypothetical protein
MKAFVVFLITGEELLIFSIIILGLMLFLITLRISFNEFNLLLVKLNVEEFLFLIDFTIPLTKSSI